MKHVLIHEIRDVADHRLRVNIVGRRVLGRCPVEIEDDSAVLFRKGQIAGAHESWRHANGVIENNCAEFPVGEVSHDSPRRRLRRIRHLAEQSHHEVRAALVRQLEQAHANTIRGGAARSKIGNEHRRGPHSVDGIHFEKIVADLEVFADFDWRQVESLFETRFRADRHPSRFDRASFRSVQRCRRPRQQFAFVKNRHQRDLVGIVDASVERVVGVPDVSIANARILRVVLVNELDDDRLNDCVQIRAARRVDQVPVRRENRHHRVAGNSEVAARRADEHLHRFVQNIVRDLYADLVIAL